MSKSTSDEGEGGDALIHLRVPAEQKARWVRESRAAGMRLTDWIVARVDGQKGKTMIQYTIRPSVLTVDTRAAADACNRELARGRGQAGRMRDRLDEQQ